MSDEDEMLKVAMDLQLARQKYFDEMLKDAAALRKSYKKKAYYEGYMDGLNTAANILWEAMLVQDEEGDEK